MQTLMVAITTSFKVLYHETTAWFSAHRHINFMMATLVSKCLHGFVPSQTTQSYLLAFCCWPLVDIPPITLRITNLFVAAVFRHVL